MENSKIVEIAEWCRAQMQNKVDTSEGMSSYRVFYAAITDDDSILVSNTPHILDGAKKCILVHEWSQLACTCSYATYRVQIINESGEVHEGLLDEKYSIGVYSARFNEMPEIYLRYQGKDIYRRSKWHNGVGMSIEELIKIVCKLYIQCKLECKIEKESRLLCELFKLKDDLRILDEKLSSSKVLEKLLESKNNEYKQILDQIKSLLKTDIQQ